MDGRDGWISLCVELPFVMEMKNIFVQIENLDDAEEIMIDFHGHCWCSIVEFTIAALDLHKIVLILEFKTKSSEQLLTPKLFFKLSKIPAFRPKFE